MPDSKLEHLELLTICDLAMSPLVPTYLVDKTVALVFFTSLAPVFTKYQNRP